MSRHEITQRPLHSTEQMKVDKSLDDAGYAFSLPDPTSRLLELVQAEPYPSTIESIVIMCIDHAQKFPSQVDKLVGALVDLTASTIAIKDSVYGPLTISRALKREFADNFQSDLSPDGSVTSSNLYLATSLLAAKTVKNSLCSPLLLAHEVYFDLNYEDPDHLRLHVPQVCVLGACIILCICGSHLLGHTKFDTGDILTTLERVKNTGFVEDPNGRQLLEVTIQQVKDGLKSDLDDAWKILFPQ